MKKLNINSKKGFTIIEVVLVLAIAGLIFLMVFIALPNLQRTQRDTSRRNDLDRLSASLIQYVANNNKLPALDEDPIWIKGSDVASTSTDVWGKFYWNYLLANGSDVFEDPDGGNYNILAAKCINTGGTTIQINGINRTTCAGQTRLLSDNAASPLNAGFNASSVTDLNGAESKYVMVVASNAMCGSEDEQNGVIVYAEGTRKFAVAMRLEGTGTYCVNN